MDINNLSFEDKIRLLASTKPGKEKQDLLNKFTFGSREFASKYFVDAMSLEEYMQVNAERFRPVAEHAARLRGQMKNHGWTDKKYQKYLGELPEELERERPEFNISLPKKIREANLRAFFQKYPQFRVDK